MDGEALLSVGIDPELTGVEATDTRSPMRRRRHIPFTGAAKEVLG